MTETQSNNMKLLAHNTLDGFGGVGEGMSLQVTNKGRRILGIAQKPEHHVLCTQAVGR